MIFSSSPSDAQVSGIHGKNFMMLLTLGAAAEMQFASKSGFGFVSVIFAVALQQSDFKWFSVTEYAFTLLYRVCAFSESPSC